MGACMPAAQPLSPLVDLLCLGLPPLVLGVLSFRGLNGRSGWLRCQGGLLGILAGLFLALLGLSALNRVYCAGLQDRTAGLLARGMSRAQTRAILGPPTEARDHGSYSADVYRVSAFTAFDKFVVTFQGDGKVSGRGVFPGWD